MPQSKRLSRQDWIDAAFEALEKGGVPAVAVEPLASRLGVTKGSFYWHFKDRGELLAAALDQWEREQTERLIGHLDSIEDPRQRLDAWARRVLGRDKALLTALHAAADNPVVAPVLQRVTERRIRYLAGIVRDAGVPAAIARRRARLLYAADLGLFQITRVLPGQQAGEAEIGRMADELVEGFLRR
jgi:AcrR family transcriptional regulator